MSREKSQHQATPPTKKTIYIDYINILLAPFFRSFNAINNPIIKACSRLNEKVASVIMEEVA